MKKNVLIVEDNPDHQFIARAHLEAQDYQVFIAEDAFKAVKILSGERIDLIVLDLWLPGLDGLGLLRNLKTNEAFSSIPVIVTSGTLREPDDILDLAEFGVGEYFVKPYEPGELVEAVDHLLL